MTATHDTPNLPGPQLWAARDRAALERCALVGLHQLPRLALDNLPQLRPAHFADQRHRSALGAVMACRRLEFVGRIGPNDYDRLVSELAAALGDAGAAETLFNELYDGSEPTDPAAYCRAIRALTRGTR